MRARVCVRRVYAGLYYITYMLQTHANEGSLIFHMPRVCRHHAYAAHLILFHLNISSFISLTH